MQTEVIEFESAKTGEPVHAVYEHPWVVRFSHWVNSIALFVLVGSGLQIFRAFPSFGDKIPQKDLLNWPKAFAIGGWLGGALQWHLTFMWIYMATG
jgi:thiosulfate reductase cytochrome b subunit